MAVSTPHETQVIQRRALYGIVQRAMTATLTSDGPFSPKACRRLLRAWLEAFTGDLSQIRGDVPSEEMVLVLRARCGLCVYRTTCKAPLV